MKKLLSIFLLLIYTATSSGTVMSAHFCMGELAGISIGEKEQEACGYCGMEDAGCCHDLLQVVKLDNSQIQKTASVSIDNKLFNIHPISVFVASRSSLYHHNTLKLPSPSYFGDPPVYLRNCIFRI